MIDDIHDEHVRYTFVEMRLIVFGGFIIYK